MILARLKPSISGFLRDSSGAVTVEFVLWMPIILAVIGLGSDIASYYSYRAIVMRIVEDANRGAAMRSTALDTEAEVKTYVKGRLGDLGSSATVTHGTKSDGSVVTSVTISSSEVMATGLLTSLLPQMVVPDLFVKGSRLKEITE